MAQGQPFEIPIYNAVLSPAQRSQRVISLTFPFAVEATNATGAVLSTDQVDVIFLNEAGEDISSTIVMDFPFMEVTSLGEEVNGGDYYQGGTTTLTRNEQNGTWPDTIHTIRLVRNTRVGYDASPTDLATAATLQALRRGLQKAYRILQELEATGVGGAISVSFNPNDLDITITDEGDDAFKFQLTDGGSPLGMGDTITITGDGGETGGNFDDGLLGLSLSNNRLSVTYNDAPQGDAVELPEGMSLSGLTLATGVRSDGTGTLTLSNGTTPISEIVLTQAGGDVILETKSGVTVLTIRAQSITGDKIAPGNIGTNHLTNSAVTTDKVRDGAITELKLAANSVSTRALANGAVTGDIIPDGGVALEKLSDNVRTAIAAGTAGEARSRANATAITAVRVKTDEIDVSNNSISVARWNNLSLSDILPAGTNLSNWRFPDFYAGDTTSGGLGNPLWLPYSRSFAGQDERDIETRLDRVALALVRVLAGCTYAINPEGIFRRLHVAYEVAQDPMNRTSNTFYNVQLPAACHGNETSFYSATTEDVGYIKRMILLNGDDLSHIDWANSKSNVIDVWDAVAPHDFGEISFDRDIEDRYTKLSGTARSLALNTGLRNHLHLSDQYAETHEIEQLREDVDNTNISVGNLSRDAATESGRIDTNERHIDLLEFQVLRGLSFGFFNPRGESGQSLGHYLSRYSDNIRTSDILGIKGANFNGEAVTDGQGMGGVLELYRDGYPPRNSDLAVIFPSTPSSESVVRELGFEPFEGDSKTFVNLNMDGPDDLMYDFNDGMGERAAVAYYFRSNPEGQAKTHQIFGYEVARGYEHIRTTGGLWVFSRGGAVPAVEGCPGDKYLWFNDSDQLESLQLYTDRWVEASSGAQILNGTAEPEGEAPNGTLYLRFRDIESPREADDLIEVWLYTTGVGWHDFWVRRNQIQILSGPLSPRVAGGGISLGTFNSSNSAGLAISDLPNVNTSGSISGHSYEEAAKILDVRDGNAARFSFIDFLRTRIGNTQVAGNPVEVYARWGINGTHTYFEFANRFRVLIIVRDTNVGRYAYYTKAPADNPNDRLPTVSDINLDGNNHIGVYCPYVLTGGNNPEHGDRISRVEILESGSYRPLRINNTTANVQAIETGRGTYYYNQEASEDDDRLLLQWRQDNNEGWHIFNTFGQDLAALQRELGLDPHDFRTSRIFETHSMEMPLGVYKKELWLDDDGYVIRQGGESGAVSTARRIGRFHEPSGWGGIRAYKSLSRRVIGDNTYVGSIINGEELHDNLRFILTQLDENGELGSDIRDTSNVPYDITGSLIRDGVHPVVGHFFHSVGTLNLVGLVYRKVDPEDASFFQYNVSTLSYDLSEVPGSTFSNVGAPYQTSIVSNVDSNMMAIDSEVHLDPDGVSVVYTLEQAHGRFEIRRRQLTVNTETGTNMNRLEISHGFVTVHVIGSPLRSSVVGRGLSVETLSGALARFDATFQGDDHGFIYNYDNESLINGLQNLRDRVDQLVTLPLSAEIHGAVTLPTHNVWSELSSLDVTIPSNYTTLVFTRDFGTTRYQQRVAIDSILALTASVPDTAVQHSVNIPFNPADSSQGQLHIGRTSDNKLLLVASGSVAIPIVSIDVELPTALSTVGETPGGGLSQSQVDARVRALTSDWAEFGNTSAIPASKLTNAPGLDQDAVDDRVETGVRENVSDWAESGNTEAIPASKLTNAPPSGLSQTAVDARVRLIVADWAERDNTASVPVSKLTTIEEWAHTETPGIPIPDEKLTEISPWARDANPDSPIPSEKMSANVRAAFNFVAQTQAEFDDSDPESNQLTVIIPS